jgi:hypothetical protein
MDEPFFLLLLLLVPAPSYAAMYMVFALAAWFLGGPGQEADARRNALVFATLGSGVLLCASKMGWITLLLLTILILYLRRRERRVLRPVAIVALCGAMLFGVLTRRWVR